MELTNELHPSELFRYVHLRNARKPAEEKSHVHFITVDDLVPNPPAETLYRDLISERINETAYTAMLQHCNAFKETDNYLSSSEDVYAALPNIKAVIRALRTEINYSENWVSEVEEVLGETITQYFSTVGIAAKKVLLWDNLLYQLFAGGDGGIVSAILEIIACVHLLENTGRIINNKEIRKYLNARVLIPQWIGEILQKEKQKSVDIGVGDKPRAENPTTTRIFRMQKSLQEFSLLQNYKQHFVREENPNPLLMSLNDISRLSTDTQTFLQELSIPLENQPIYSLIGYLQKLISLEKSQSNNLVKAQRVTRVGDALLRTEGDCFKFEDTDPCGEKPRKPFASGGSFVNTLYVGDLLVTQQQLLRYDLGEVAHIENVMASEEKERTHRRLDRSELTETSEREIENETERETQTTERFSIEKEASKVLQQSLNLNASVTVSASYGTVASLEVSSGFGYNNSSTESQNEATSFSKQVTDRALTRVKEHIRETRSLKIIKEIEETASHKFSNLAANGVQPEHINGVFRWVDKYYLNKVVNYGKRLMVEFTVPEPANFYIFRKVNAPAEGEQMTLPIHPAENEELTGTALSDFNKIDESNYILWAAAYGLTDVDIQLPSYKTVSKTYKIDFQGEDDSALVDDKLVIPKGFLAHHAHFTQDFYDNSNAGFKIRVQIGDQSQVHTYPHSTLPPSYMPLNLSIWTMEEDCIPVSIKLWVPYVSPKVCAIINVIVVCTPSLEGILAWKQKVYAKIMEAYENQKKAYNEWVNAQQAYSAYQINGNNPEINRQIEREELKKRCLELFTGQRFDSFDAATNGIQNQSNYPEILFQEAIQEGRWVSLLEQIFDWENITYAFYPYFYGRKQNWQVITNLSDNDPLFGNFLKAGYAKAVVPVRKGFEEQVMMFHFLTFLFNGGSLAQVPGIETDAYQTLLEDLHTLDDQAEHEAVYDEANVIGTYIQKVPTNLVFLTEDLPTGTPNTQKLTDNRNHQDIVSYL